MYIPQVYGHENCNNNNNNNNIDNINNNNYNELRVEATRNRLELCPRLVVIYTSSRLLFINPLVLRSSSGNCPLDQGLTVRFQARGPERSFDENQWSKRGFLVNLIYIVSFNGYISIDI